MAGERSGRLAYVVVSEGGLAGVGERFRKLPWSAARVDGESLISVVDSASYRTLPEVEKDEWPAH